MTKAREYFKLLENDTRVFSTAQDESLEEHDAKYHPGGFKEGDRCKLREEGGKVQDKRMMKFKFLVGGVNGYNEEHWSTAPSFQKAISDARMFGCNGWRKLYSKVWVKPLVCDGYVCKKNAIIWGDDLLSQPRIIQFDKFLKSDYRRKIAGRSSAESGARSGIREVPVSSAESKGTVRPPREGQGESGNDPSRDHARDWDSGRESTRRELSGSSGSGSAYGSLSRAPEPPVRKDGKTGKVVQEEFSFDRALSPVERYLAMCANDLGRDVEAQDETLELHDKKYHPGGYEEGDECKFRDGLVKKGENESEPKGVKCPQSERDAVIAKYKGTDEWMRAPNGKPTKLNENQWVQVRTPSFMKCFGDWPKEEEVTRIGNWLMTSGPVVALRGDEFGPNGEKLTDKVPRWFDEECGGVVESPEFGKVVLDREGVKDDLGHKMNRVKACAFAAVPDVIEKGKAFNRASNWKERGWDSAVIAAPIRIGKDDYICEVVIKDDGDRRGFYLHRVDYIDKFKLSLAMDPNYKKDGDKPISQNIIAELTDECKQHPCCRDVDENGEPKASNICVEDSAAKARERYLEMVAEDAKPIGVNKDGTFCYTEGCEKQAYKFSDDASDVIGGGGLERDEERAKREYNEVEKRYKETAAWMRAPNVKATNLTERQWVQVRTPSFKKWFGDWEKCILGSATEDECKVVVDGWRRNRTEFRNKETGRVAEIKSDWSKLFSSVAKGESASYEAHYAAVMALDRLFEDSVLMWKEDPRNGSNDISSYAKYGQPFWFEGEAYLAKMTVKEYAQHVGIKDGFYSIEAIAVEKINVAGNSGNISVKGQVLDRDVSNRISKRLDRVNGVSKVVDENGEPKVVYHGTADEFTEFDPGHRKGICASSWFAEEMAVAENYTHYGNGEPRVIEAFLNVKNPYDLRDTEFDGGAQIDDERNDGGQASEKEIALAAEISGMTPKEVHDKFYLQALWTVTQSSEMAKYAQSKGYDGIYLDEYGDNTIGVFKPNQIKSATENVGTFSYKSSDVKDSAAKRYLEICQDSIGRDAAAQDEWVDSGDGNIAWKPRAKGKRKKPIDRVPKRKIHEIIAENVSLIKTVDKKMLPWVAKNVYRLLNGKMTPDDFVDWLMDECDLSEGRAGVIACDQVTKAKEKIKVEDWKMRGIKFAMWKHKDGEKDPRDYHVAKWDGKSGVRNGSPNGLDGFIFNLDKPPVIDKKTKQRGYPSTLIGCRCYLKGVKA